MVARLLRLRVALLGSQLRGSFWYVLRTLFGMLVLAAAAIALAALPVWFSAGEARANVDTILMAGVLAAIVCVPFFENRTLLEPRQFGQFPATPGAIGGALLLTTVATWPFVLFAIWLGALVVVRPEWQAAGWVTPVALILAALFAVTSVRVVSALSKLLAGVRYAGAFRTVGVVLLIALLPVAIYAVTSALGPQGFAVGEDSAETLSWTPIGAPAAAIAFAIAGDETAALLRMGVIAASFLVLLLIWFPLNRISLDRLERPIGTDVARTGLGWFERFGARPAQVIAARELTYWARDPRYRVALFAIPVAPALMIGAFWVAGADAHALALLPLPVILLLLGWSQHNDVSMDSTAIWEHVASGIRGRSDRAGRLAPVLLIGIPLALIGSSITVTIMGDWRVLPAVIGMNLAVLCSASASSSVFSALMPYPTTRPGDSPFVQPQWSGSGSGLAQTLSMLTAILLAIAPVWFAIDAITDVELIGNLWALAFGIGYGAVVLAAGIAIGGKLFDRRGPELIAVTQVFD